MQDGRLDNAGHLIGFAAECAIKYRISTLTPPPNSPMVHLPELLLVARKHLGPRSAYGTSMFDAIRGDIFSGWQVGNRYLATGHTQAADLAAWMKQTQRLFATANLKEDA